MYFDTDQKSGFIVLLNGEPRGRGIDEEILEIMNRAMTASAVTRQNPALQS
jgi:hypothetical protein